MLEAAAFCAEPDDALHAGPRVMMSRKLERAGAGRARAARCIASIASTLSALRDRDLQPLGRGRLDDEIGGAGAHRRDDGLDAALRRLHDHRQRDAALAHRLEHAEPVDAGHGEIEDDAPHVAAVRAVERLQRRFAAVGDDRLVAEALTWRLEQAALHGIVVDDENRGRS